MDFNIGYYEGSQQAKLWLVNSENIKMMYRKFPKCGSITIWCDGRVDKSVEDRPSKRKHDSDKTIGKRREQEDDVDTFYKQLQGKHSDKYDIPWLQLWARMMASGLHDNLDSPPDVLPLQSQNSGKSPCLKH